jgi:hypothetical protein
MTFWSELLFIALAIFVWNEAEKSIARRTADEIERRSKPHAPPSPKTPSVFSSPRLALAGAAIGSIGLLAVLARGW